MTTFNKRSNGESVVELKTVSGQKIKANSISCILTGRVAAASGILVQLKTGEEVLLDNTEAEVVEEMNRFDIEMPR